eukprot:CAMPEP_0116144592 /NCGR_PEP_ID=MMETSP0329-20121206/16092_1 /TAXON_ID=697910 /ORGANISM="Pseudo-nitzschia arenysensis, Strain B593" /LENGTH=45 /DNA_ID= /DNA_START= /DNA_END= /DNA_ORIENTATION=
MNYVEDTSQTTLSRDQINGKHSGSGLGALGVDRNRISMSTPKTMT